MNVLVVSSLFVAWWLVVGYSSCDVVEINVETTENGAINPVLSSSERAVVLRGYAFVVLTCTIMSVLDFASCWA